MNEPTDKAATGSKRKPVKAAQKLRTGVQIFFFSFVVFLTAGKALSAAGITLPLLGAVSLHSICPFGGVETFYQFLTVGTFIQKIHASAFVLMVIVLLLSILFGPVLCGWFCPLGSLQEWIGKLGKKIFKQRYNNMIPQRVDRVLRYLRYVVLALVVYMTATSATLLFQSVDPYYAMFNFYTGEVAITAFIVLGATMLLSLFVERPWCKYACPYGALLGIFNRLRIFAIRRRVSSCIDCKACDNACPMNIEVSGTSTVRDHQCISCMKCTSESACPIGDTVALAAKGEK